MEDIIPYNWVLSRDVGSKLNREENDELKETINVLGFAGSLRNGSYNRALLRSAQKLAPEGLVIDITELNEIPLYSGDVEEKGLPEAVSSFKNRIKEADALLIATPEYNYSIPGVLKNAIDWASRPPTGVPLVGKPVAIFGATSGGFGTVRAQQHLRQVCAAVKMPAFVGVEVYVSRARNSFDEDGNLVDDQVAGQLQNFLNAFYLWIQKLV
jgi:chromate reductase